MQCLWPICGRSARVFLATLVGTASLSANVAPSLRRAAQLPPLVLRERSLRRAPAHMAEFTPIRASAFSSSCANTRPPEALLTPDPIMQDISEDMLIRVSFIVGADGRVHSAFILDSGGRDQDRTILRAVGHWRFRPALCNGVPTPMEARVSFVLH